MVEKEKRICDDGTGEGEEKERQEIDKPDLYCYRCCFLFCLLFFPDVDGGSVREESEKNCICGDVIIARASFVRIVQIFRLAVEKKEECTIEKVKVDV